MQPTIGITTRPRIVHTSGGDLGVDSVQHTYRNSVARAGGIPLPLSPVEHETIPALLAKVDGLVLTGGGDVDPAIYDGRGNETNYDIQPDRDEFEIALVRVAKKMDLPTLAICRGLQVVNVALGGTLIQDIPTEVGSFDHAINGKEVFFGHQHVTLDPASAVAIATGNSELKVNSIHHQSVRDLGAGLKAVGWADDGVIEAVEPIDGLWPLLAVQWHPEYLSDAGDGPSRALFSRLVELASTKASS